MIRGFIVGVAMLTASACADDGGCTQDYDCPSTEVCNLASGACEPLRCEVDDDCSLPTERCQENVCVSGD